MNKIDLQPNILTLGGVFDLGDLSKTDGAIFEAFRNDVETIMLVSLNSPTKKEIDSLSGVKHVSLLLCDHGAAFLMFNTPRVNFDMSINTKVIDKSILETYNWKAGERLIVNLVVVDSATSKIALLGAFTLPEMVTKDLNGVLAHQQKYTAEDINMANANFMNQYDVHTMIRMAGIIDKPSTYQCGK